MKKGMINFVILALVLVNLVLSVILVFTFVPAVSKTNNLVDKIAKIVDLNVSGDSTENGAPSAEDTEYVQVKFSDDETSQVFTLKQGTSDSKVHYLKLSVTIKLDKRQSDYKDKKKLIESTMTTYLGSEVGDIVIEYTKEEASNSKKEMENRLLKALQAYYDTGAMSNPQEENCKIGVK